MRLGDDIDLGCGITGKVIGRTFEQDTRVDLLTPWGVLNGVRLTALVHGLALNPERADVNAHNSAKDKAGSGSESDATVDLETPWGRLRAVPLMVLENHAERRRKAPPEGSVPLEIKALAAETAMAAASSKLPALKGKAGPSPLSRGVWPRRPSPLGVGRRVA